MNEQQTSKPVLRREARTQTRSESQLGSYVAITAVIFSVLGVMTGLGLSWLVMPPNQVTVVREAPRVSSWCTETREYGLENGKIILLNKQSKHDTLNEAGNEVENQASGDRHGASSADHAEALEHSHTEIRAGGKVWVIQRDGDDVYIDLSERDQSVEPE